MKKRLIISNVLLVVLILLSLSRATYAQSDYPTETTVVGRIVGDTPGELEQQLLLKELNLKHSTYVAPYNGADKARAVVRTQFPDNFEEVFGSEWDWEHGVTGDVNKFESQEYFILESKSGKSGDSKLLDKKLTLQDAKSWANSFRNNKPLFVFSTEYGGIYLPKQESFMSILGQDSVTVTTNAHYSSQFTKSFICNLAGPQTVGEAFRNARNDYYSGAHNDHFLFWRTHGESVGLPLYSYLLYGNPLVKVTLPDKGESAVKSFCKEFPSGIKTNSQATLQALSSESGSNNGNYVFTVKNWTVKNTDGYGIIMADNLESAYEPFELVISRKVLKHEFPLKTIVTDVSLVSFEEPVELTIPNLPSWENGLTNRSCYYEQKDAELEFAHASENDREAIIIEISPVEVVDCTNGKFKLYTKATYKIDYIPFSPVLIKEVAVQSEAFPGQSVAANVSLQNLQSAAFEGELVLNSIGSSGELEEHVAEKKIIFAAEQQETAVELAFAAGSEEGIANFRLEFIQDGEAKTFHEFGIKVKSLELSLTAPATAGESGEAVLTITNSLTTPIEAVVSSYILKGEEIVTATQEKNLEPGPNEVKISYEGLKREDASYSLLATVNYGSSKETAAATLVTNHPPIIEPVADVTVTEGEKAVLSPVAADVDGDEVQITYTGKMESSEWQTNVGDAGSYEATITASDGLLYDSQTINITVLEDKDVDKDGFEKGSDCNDNDASINPAAEEKCNNKDDNCDSQTDESLQKTESCGYCGTTTTACGNGQWLANVTCEGQGPCSPGNEETQSCGYGGKQFRKCSETCAWTQWSECGSQGECQAGDEQEQKCGTTDTGTCEYGTQSRSCKADYYWELWTECEGNTEPAAELCDGLDNNCNGEADEGLEDLNSDGKCDSPPVLSPIGNRAVKENETLSIALAAYDYNGDSLTYSSSQLPQGASLVEGVFSWAPTFSQAGSHTIEFAVSDGLLQGKESISITVANVNRAPEAKIVLEPAGQAGYYANEGELKLLKADASDPDGDDLYYAWWYLGNADWQQQGTKKLVSLSNYLYFFPNYTDGDGNNVHKFLLNVSDGNITVNSAVDLVVVNAQDCKPKAVQTEPCGSSIGACKQGQKNRTCGTDFKWSDWGDCLGEVKPQPADDCGTWEDDDCDGVVNNGCMNSPDLATSWMSWKLYDTSSGEISTHSIGNASLAMRPYLYGEVINLGSDDSLPALAAWYLNGRHMVSTRLPRLNASEKAPVSVYMPYPPYEGMNNISLIIDADKKIKEKNEKNNQIDFPITIKYNETHKPWAKMYGEDNYKKFPTQEECENQGKCW